MFVHAFCWPVEFVVVCLVRKPHQHTAIWTIRYMCAKCENWYACQRIHCAAIHFVLKVHLMWHLISFTCKCYTRFALGIFIHIYNSAYWMHFEIIQNRWDMDQCCAFVVGISLSLSLSFFASLEWTGIQCLPRINQHRHYYSYEIGRIRSLSVCKHVRFINLLAENIMQYNELYTILQKKTWIQQKLHEFSILLGKHNDLM